MLEFSFMLEFLIFLAQDWQSQAALREKGNVHHSKGGEKEKDYTTTILSRRRYYA
jgi:hypothetical protein